MKCVYWTLVQCDETPQVAKPPRLIRRVGWRCRQWRVELHDLDGGSKSLLASEIYFDSQGHGGADAFSAGGDDRGLVASRIDELQIGSQMQPWRNRNIVKELHALLVVEANPRKQQGRKCRAARRSLSDNNSRCRSDLPARGNHPFAAESKAIELRDRVDLAVGNSKSPKNANLASGLSCLDKNIDRSCT